jgi:hypothetical protein
MRSKFTFLHEIKSFCKIVQGVEMGLGALGGVSILGFFSYLT